MTRTDPQPRRTPPWHALSLMLLLLASCGGLLRTPEPAPRRPTPSAWSADDLTIAWLGHASVLVGMKETRILTDPAFYERIGVTLGPLVLGPKRFVATALEPAELPALDAVVISHAHMDSLDIHSLKAIAAKAGMVITPERTADLYEGLGFARVVELAWGETVEVGDTEVEAVPVDHWGKRLPWDDWRGYNAYLFRRGDVDVLFAPDTAYTEELGVAGQRVGLDAAIIGNGAYDPWIRNHADPEQVWKMYDQTGGNALLPVHYDTFALGDEPRGDALRRVLAAAGPRSEEVVLREIGGTWRAPCCVDAERDGR